MSVHVVAVDEQTGERAEHTIPAGDYLLICVRPSHRTSVKKYPDGVHVITVAGMDAVEVVGKTIGWVGAPAASAIPADMTAAKLYEIAEGLEFGYIPGPEFIAEIRAWAAAVGTPTPPEEEQ